MKSPIRDYRAYAFEICMAPSRRAANGKQLAHAKRMVAQFAANVEDYRRRVAEEQSEIDKAMASCGFRADDRHLRFLTEELASYEKALESWKHHARQD